MVLVTGDNGFIGKHLASALKSRDVNVVGVNRKKGVDITNWEQIKQIEKVDLVYHLAAIVFVPFAFENPKLTYDVNVLGTLNILELCRIKDIDKIVFTSSYLYGKPKYLPIDEKHPLAPHNPYSHSKLVGEELCRGYHEDYGLSCIILRPFNVYGPGQNEKFLIPSIIKQLKERDRIELMDPTPRRDFINVTDLANAYLKAKEYKRNTFDIFNIGSGTSYSVGEIVEKLIVISGKKIHVNFKGGRRKHEIQDTRADIRKAKKFLKWEPIIGIDEGLKAGMKYSCPQ